MAASPGKEDAENTLANTLERKIFQQQATRSLTGLTDGNRTLQTKITGFRDWYEEDNGVCEIIEKAV
ncbi:hypothetical protein [Bacteroides ovatus]|uniref:hypothetical protein n=1 Tax=Bacteroides ovatus TaxID=28116 RepID=UPI000310E60B|nr:hypothetical protein [Bacteroides ovatus]